VPIYRLMFSKHIAFGFPPTDWALEVYLRLLSQEAPHAPWMVAGLGVEIQPLIELAVMCGGHVRVGLEDAPMGCTLGNQALAQDGGLRITAAGGRLASASEVRAALKAASVANS
jgi:3-keto-5-aminohexanoate cleavage enzyme